MASPYLFDEFFASGMEESISPFLTPGSRRFGKNLGLKSASVAAFFLCAAFGSSFYSIPLSHLFLSFVYFLVGVPALIAAISDAKQLEVNIDMLMTLAAFTALFIDSGLEGALLLVLFEISHGLEDAVSVKAKSALHHLNHIAPKSAIMIDDRGNFFEKAVKEIQVGEIVFVKNGEIVPLDGMVIEGISSVNLVHLTGESIPVRKKCKDTVPAGARNLEGALSIQVTRTSSDSTLSRIIQLITQAQQGKPHLQRWIDRFGKHYATSIISLTFLFAFFLPLIPAISFFGRDGSLYRALAFLIAASPCALIIATPTAYLSAISACAKKGILLKGGITLDALAGCSTIAFDKTGTLTTGELICNKAEPIGPGQFDLETAIAIAFALERNVVHPIAKALCRFAGSKNITPAEISNFKCVPGSGLEGLFQNIPVYIGLPDWVASKIDVQKKDTLSKHMAWASSQHSPNHKVSDPRQSLISHDIQAILAVGSDLFIFEFSDELRSASKELILGLKTKAQLKTVMLTGDRRKNAEEVGTLLGIDHIFSDLRPEDKLSKVAELSQKETLAMVGDGINDAPALARASVGISMGKIGSATAVDASDAILLNDDLHLLHWLFEKARLTLKIVKQNLGLALGVIILATLPALLGWIPLWAAVILHEGGTVLVGLNSLRLLRTESLDFY